MIRLAKFISDCTTSSTRQSLHKLATGHITVDGKPQFENILIDPQRATVQCDYRVLSQLPKQFYLFHKPMSVLCTKKNTNETRKTVYDYCHDPTVFTVGRLDYATTGLIILTNDGSISKAILQPSSQITKEYHISASHHAIDTIKQHLPKVVSTIDRLYHIHSWQSLSHTRISIILTEGKNREVRYIVAQCGITDYTLHREKIGKLSIGTLKPGQLQKVSRQYIVDNLH